MTYAPITHLGMTGFSRLLAVSLLLLAIFVTLSALMQLSSEGYAEVDRVVLLQEAADTDANDPSALTPIVDLKILSLYLAEAYSTRLLLPAIGGYFLPDPHPPKAA